MIPRNETATEEKCVRLRSKLAGFARGMGAGGRLAEKRREAGGGQAGRDGALEAGERKARLEGYPRAPGLAAPGNEWTLKSRQHLNKNGNQTLVNHCSR